MPMIFRTLTNELETAWWFYISLGIALILFGILIILVPQILIAMIASLFILFGGLMLLLGWHMRRSMRSFRHIIYEFFE